MEKEPKARHLCLVRDDTHMASMRIVQFSRPPLPSSPRPRFFKLLDLGHPISNEPPPPSPNDNHQLKVNIVQGWLLYVIRSFYQVGFCFQ